ncbi:MAG: YlmC/YmxH family sporulation protein [Syntrophomonadaceae bacterium]|nr:YlmC/YmxH family sporulation protein [Syntrophomonadaceae bacterium]
MIRVSDLRQRDVINIADGRRLGMIKDFDLELEEGRVKAIMLPGPGKIMGLFGRNDDLEIPWEKIVKIGVDVILVDIRAFTNVHHPKETANA